MSKVVHRKPVWGWGVVLLSTLLLSPVAANALLAALAAQQASPSLAKGASAPGVASATSSPRRADDEDALRAAARGDRPLTLRLDTQHPDAAAVALVFSSQTILLVPDDVPAVRAPAPGTAPRLCSHAATPPRAPPA